MYIALYTVLQYTTESTINSAIHCTYTTHCNFSSFGEFVEGGH